MASYGFCFRASMRAGDYAGKLYLRVVHGGRSASVTTGYRVWASEWDAERRHLKVPRGDGPRTRELIDYQLSMRGDECRLEGIIREFERREFYTAADVVAKYRALTTRGIKGYMEELAKEMESCGCDNTARTYRKAVSRFREFNGGRDVGFEGITARAVKDFQMSLKSKGLGTNTVALYVRTLRVIYNKAVEGMYISAHAENPFAGVFTGVSATRKRALTAQEMALLSAADPSLGMCRPRMLEVDEVSLAMFLFCCHARGMCFVDMAHLRKSDIHDDMIRYRRRKTGRIIEVKIVPPMRRILDWIAPRTAATDYVFPVFVDPSQDMLLQYESGLRRQNRCLKRVARLCGIPGERLTTHASRHSWATIARDQGLPLAVISEGLGHSNQRTTEIYLASLEQSVLDNASLVVSRAMGAI